VVKGERVKPFLLSLPQKLKIRQVYFQLQRTEDVDCSYPFTISPLNTATLQSPEDTLPTFDLKAYARRGAEARIAELTAELNDIYKAFPDLRRGAASATSTAAAGGRRRGRKPMSAAQKAAVSKRMKNYWAERKKASK
jgi:hypothetical protein